MTTGPIKKGLGVEGIQEGMVKHPRVCSGKPLRWLCRLAEITEIHGDL